MARPIPRFGAFLGQPHVIRKTRIMIKGARARGRPFANCLLAGPSGTGKSLLAAAIADAFGVTLHKFDASNPPPDVKFPAFLMVGNPGDILFIDEAHRLNKREQDALRSVLDQGERAVSMLVATDQLGFVQPQIANRIRGELTMRPYTVGELREIIFEVAAGMDLLLSGQCATALAKASHGIPRTAKNLLENLSDFLAAAEHQTSQVTLAVARKCLRAYGIDSLGLTIADRRMLMELSKRGNQSRRVLAVSLGCDDTAVHRFTVRLFRLGFVTLNHHGCSITAAGRQWISDSDGMSTDKAI